jgi:GWxTD domain-containing protein
MTLARPLTAFFMLFSITAALAQEPDNSMTPASALAAGRQAIQQQRFDEAIHVMQSAIPLAAQLENQKERMQALAALHFYSAIAFDSAGDENGSRQELQQFFAFNPGAGALDPTKFDRRFVKLYNDVHKQSRAEGGSRFELIYPGFQTFTATSLRAPQLSDWNDSAEFILLSNSSEKNEWKTLSDDAGRAAFVERFWARRDLSPDTPENEYRQEFTRRAAFADETFGTERTRGSLSDRGRVFVLLGIPQAISVKPLTGREGGSMKPVGAGSVSVQTKTPEDDAMKTWKAMDAASKAPPVGSDTPSQKGLVERWTYRRDQLPATVPNTEVVFKFITDEGYGDHVMQREFFCLKALQDAAQLR